MIRIIAGKYKNRLIPTIDKTKYRPSTGKFREAVFSILLSLQSKGYKSIEDAKVLDLFCGTGSLGFEALSRGASFAHFIDIDAEVIQYAKAFSQIIGAVSQTSFTNIDVLDLTKAYRKYDLVFLDPPYYKGLVLKSIEVLIKQNWLNDEAILVAEMATTDNTLTDKLEALNLTIIDERVYGKNKLLILQKNA